MEIAELPATFPSDGGFDELNMADAAAAAEQMVRCAACASRALHQPTGSHCSTVSARRLLQRLSKKHRWWRLRFTPRCSESAPRVHRSSGVPRVALAAEP
jgi:hypothetical protein